MSHVVGDGCTFYEVHNMVVGASECAALDIKRKWDVQEKIDEAIQTKKELFTPFFFAGLVFRLIYGNLLRKKPRSLLCYLDDEWVKEQKRTPGEGVSFVSTNDCITSWFLGRFDLSFFLLCLYKI